MKHFKVEAFLREDLGKKATKKIRKEGNIPCVIYGAEKNIHFYTSLSAVRKLIYTPEVMFANIELNKQVKIATIQEIQFHPVSDDILHIDFYELDTNKPVVMPVPIRTTGNAEGVKAGGKLMVDIRKVTVKAMMNDMPEFYEIDITALEIGDSVKVKDLDEDKLEFTDTPTNVIVMVSSARGVMAEEEEEEVEGEEGEEGEEGAEGTEGAEGAKSEHKDSKE